MNIIQTDDAAAPLGHYSQAVEHNGTLYISGQLPIDPKSPDTFIEGIEAQTQKTLENVKACLEAAGMGLEHVLKVTIYISDISIWADVNKVYAEFFGPYKPARAAVPTKALPRDFYLEIEAIAAK